MWLDEECSASVYIIVIAPMITGNTVCTKFAVGVCVDVWLCLCAASRSILLLTGLAEMLLRDRILSSTLCLAFWCRSPRGVPREPCPRGPAGGATPQGFRWGS